ncbi:hypothetical protein Acr_07g0011140 [Actinidia rufa]|uniref:Uncharacterized protein n=1 Tax=Actinidia rufa TaxID=165716 RepID=A0A7J0EWZ4_9ERIC|nr:hypothetical protein Acr_07g0011140 [Actinidia rufa]
MGRGRTTGLNKGDRRDQVYPKEHSIQAEASNKKNHEGIKKRLEKAKEKWVDELPSVLWAYRITLRKAMNERPYFLAFGFKAIISLKVDLPTIRTEAYGANHNEEVLTRGLNLTEERRENALIQMADYQKQLAKTYNQRVQMQRSFGWRPRLEKGCWKYQGPDRKKARSELGRALHDS